ATINPATYKNNILAGKAGIWNMNANEVLQWEQQLQESVPEARLAVIASPVGDDGIGGNFMNAPMTRNFLINAKVDKEKAIPSSPTGEAITAKRASGTDSCSCCSHCNTSFA